MSANTEVRSQPTGGRQKMSLRSILIWAAIAIVGAVCWAVLALSRGEQISALWILFAALASYFIAYRFYARFIAYRVLAVDDTRATPAERLHNGVDFDITDRRVLFGHHFAAIAGAGPLVGPVLAAQMGYLPGTAWIIFGVILAGAVLVNALAESPWGVFSVGLTIPIALFMGFYLRFIRPGRVMESPGRTHHR
jgi:carbon starvation protein